MNITTDDLYLEDPDRADSIITRLYILNLIQPYIDAMATANTRDDILNWLPQIFPQDDIENVIILIRIFSSDQLSNRDNAVMGVIKYLVYIAIEEPIRLETSSYQTITAWDIASKRSPLAQRLFGPPSDKLLITVIVDGKRFTHEVTEEFTKGLISVNTNDIRKINVELEGELLSPRDFHLPTDMNNYRARIINQTILFDTPDFIYGVITAAEWLGLDPHVVISDFYNIRTGMPMNFD